MRPARRRAGRPPAISRSARAAAAGGRRDELPRRLGDIITPALDRLAGGDEARAYAAWARAVGEPVSGGTRPKAFRRGQLTIECASSVWANELTYLGPQILRRMDEVAPGHPVERFRFIVGRLSPPPPEPDEALWQTGAAELADEALKGPVGQDSRRSAAKKNRRHERPAPVEHDDGAGPGRRSAGRTTPGGHRGRSATGIRGASRGPRRRRPVWLTKTPGLRRFCHALRVALSLRFWYTQAGRYQPASRYTAQPLGHCEVV